MIPFIILALIVWMLILHSRNNDLSRQIRELQIDIGRLAAHLGKRQHSDTAAAADTSGTPSADSPHETTAQTPGRPQASAPTAKPPSQQYPPKPQDSVWPWPDSPATDAAAYETPLPTEPHDQPALAANRGQSPRPSEYQPVFQWQKLRDNLIAIGLWPDTRNGSLETQLTTFIATRLGILLGVAALVFLAVYLGRDMSPWVRLVQLLVVPVALGVASRRLKHRTPAFARVLLAGAMAMFYFASVAAYALPATRVVEQPWLGFVLQIAVLAATGILATAKRDQALAVMTLILGFAACGFAWYHGMANYLLSGSFLLGAAGALLYVARRWRSCLWLGMAGAYAFYQLVLQSSGCADIPPDWVQWTYPLLAYLLFFASERFTAVRLRLSGNTESEIQTRLHHSVNTALALLVGLYAIYTYQEARVAWFYLGATAVAAATALSFRLKPQSVWLTSQFLLKASLLFSIFLLEILDGNIRCLALLLQALLLLEAVRRHPSKSAYASAGIAWLFSLYYFAQIQITGPVYLWQPTHLWLSLYIVGASAALIFGTRVLQAGISREGHKLIQILCGILLGFTVCISGLWLATSLLSSLAERSILNALLLALPAGIWLLASRTGKNGQHTSAANGPAIATARASTRSGATAIAVTGAAIASGIALIWAHGLSWLALNQIAPVALTAPTTFTLCSWIMVLIAVTLSVALSIPLHRSIVNAVAQHAAMLLALCTLSALINTFVRGPAMLLAAVLLGWAVVALATLPRYRQLAYTRLLPLLFGMAAIESGVTTNTETRLIAWGALTLAFLWQIALPQIKALRSGCEVFSLRVVRIAQGILLLCTTLLLVDNIDRMNTQTLVLLVIAVLAYAMHHWQQPRLWLAQALILMLSGQFYSFIQWAIVSYPPAALLPVYATQVALSILTLLLARSIARQLPESEPSLRTTLIYSAAALLALVPLFAIPQYRPETQTWLSLWLALPTFALIGAGLVLKCRPYRLIGFIALLLPLSRLFLYDIRDTVSRIAAFGILAVLLLLVGYIYNRIQVSEKRTD